MNKKQKDFNKKYIKVSNVLRDFSELNPIAILGRLGGKGTNPRDKRVELNEAEESAVQTALTGFRDAFNETLVENEPGNLGGNSEK
jgi:hypothetical protein